MLTQFCHAYRAKRSIQGGVFIEVLKALNSSISSKCQQLAVVCPNLINAMAIIRNGELAVFGKVHLCHGQQTIWQQRI